ncbi:hypothetical protein SprV_0100433200 [Sparganum proliferum]
MHALTSLDDVAACTSSRAEILGSKSGQLDSCSPTATETEYRRSKYPQPSLRKLKKSLRVSSTFEGCSMEIVVSAKYCLRSSMADFVVILEIWRKDSSLRDLGSSRLDRHLQGSSVDLAAEVALGEFRNFLDYSIN